METAIYFIAGILFLCLTLYYHGLYRYYKKRTTQLDNKFKSLNIAYDDYTHYQKAYINYYKWLNKSFSNTDNGLMAKTVYENCIIKYEDMFNIKD